MGLNARRRVVELSGSSTKSNKTVLVAGGAGFLGSQLCTRLITRGANVICVDNLLSGRISNIASLVNHARFTFLEHDVIEPLQIDGEIDQIYNLACAASPPRYQRDPIHTFKTNVTGAMNLLDLAVAKNARILQASTSEIYGDPTVTPQAETYRGNVNTYGPRACYDEGKRAAETLFYEYTQQFGVVTKIARIFNTYGPCMCPEDGRVVSNFTMQALRGEPITIYGDGSQTRSFCYCDDLLDGLERLMVSSPQVCAPVNLGNPTEFTVKQLAELVVDLTGSDSSVVYHDLPTDDPKQRKPDISQARRLLHWSPKVSLRDGLIRTIPYFQSELNRNRSENMIGAR